MKTKVEWSFEARVDFEAILLARREQSVKGARELRKRFWPLLIGFVTTRILAVTLLRWGGLEHSVASSPACTSSTTGTSRTRSSSFRSVMDELMSSGRANEPALFALRSSLL